MDLFTEGQKIALLFQKDNNLVEMTCAIEKVFDDRLDLILPQYFMRYIEYLQVGKKVTVKAFSKLGTVDFNSIIISSPLEDTFSIELDYNCVKLSSGEELPTVNAVENLDVTTEEGTFSLKTFELSDRYIKFYSDKKFKVEEVLNCSLILPKDYGIIEFRASVSEIDPIYDNEYTAVFSTMSEAAKQALLYYMYIYSTDSN